ncbi:sulfate permease, SulP family [Oceanospirillum multiglobuliferum]|uniref:Sodium-independent anion transporter n=1 Tax=Oceanospirillum multiglobuliferum TaxID=64969 RepID=A0A1T4MSG1_9GAMM|nr:sulfate permease [Oceanospirillum multiglobuliferum]OPX56915.1 sodium-independent anion transporter [Oceanospirillum multiglobuliferum]SJZ69744.1 sulfate permease, SulP family [Oceanospirillum multiglobuliferum]
MSDVKPTGSPSKNSRWQQIFPIIGWLGQYRRETLINDSIAGIIVAIMLVPQGMAYAFLAGLPPQMGLYAGIIPLFIYALFGSSRSLAVGPVAIASLMVGEAVAQHAQVGTQDYIATAMVLALLVGIILLLMFVLRLGSLVNFMSHSVITGFTSAAALMIAFSQLKSVFGLSFPRSHSFPESLVLFTEALPSFNITTLAISALSLIIMLLSKYRLSFWLQAAGLSKTVASALAKAGPMFAILTGVLLVQIFDLDKTQGVKVVGDIPAGFPILSLLEVDLVLWQALLPAALLIALIGFLESVSVGTALASKHRERISPDKELVALGLANIGAAFSGAYPVAGGFGRSMVNDASGAQTTVASLITATGLALTVLFFTPWFYYLPTGVLGIVVIMAVLPLIDLSGIKNTWRFNRADALTLLTTFLVVLIAGVEIGLLSGMALSILLLLHRTSHPHMAVVGRVGNSEHFRNIKRFDVKTNPCCLGVRIDENLYFANTRHIEDTIMAMVAEQPQLQHLVLICSAISFIDASALETLEMLRDNLRESGVTLHLADVKGPVMDQLKQTDFLDHMGDGQVYLSTHEAMRQLCDL